MIIEKAVFGSLFFTVIVQGLRQLLPNIVALPVKVPYEGLEKFNPDVVLRVTFSSISLLLSFRLVLFLD